MNYQTILALRKETGCGIADAKAAISEAGDDYKKAVDLLKSKTRVRQGRATNHGRVEV